MDARLYAELIALDKALTNHPLAPVFMEIIRLRLAALRLEAVIMTSNRRAKKGRK